VSIAAMAGGQAPGHGPRGPVVLRAPGRDETETLVAIQRAAAVDGFAHVFSPERYPFPDDAVRERWHVALARGTSEILVAERDGEPLGLAAWSHEWLESLYVVPAAQGQGVGSLLHDEALARLRARGDAVCRLWTLADNHVARRFYERRGWQLGGRTRLVSFPPHPLAVGYTRTIAPC
jgi:GNAT superfamily N-acetyltransferase